MNPAPASIAIVLAGALSLAATPVIAQAAASANGLAIFGVPLGGTISQVEQMAAQRGYGRQVRPTHCPGAELCKSEANFENIVGTEFLNHAWGWKALPDRKESFRFVFMAPPNDQRIWSAGSDQTFGTWSAPSPAAPLLKDVLQELNRRFGTPVAALGIGGAKTVAPGEQPGQYWWLWDARGNSVPWSQAVRNTCYTALAQTATVPGSGASGSGNTSVTDPRPFQLARQGNCARAVRVEIGQTRGLVHTLLVRMVDLKAGHDANFKTTRHISTLRAGANNDRSARNKPDF